MKAHLIWLDSALRRQWHNQRPTPLGEALKISQAWYQGDYSLWASKPVGRLHLRKEIVCSK